MKRLFGFGRKRKGPPPSGGASPPCNPGAYELREKELGKLHRAAASGDLAQVRQALRKRNIDGRDKAKRTPLHLACANGHSEVVSYLVENKCKLNLCDSDDRSPLMKAVQCQQEQCVAILLAHGADPNLADALGNTALHLAALAPNASLAGQLLEHNAHIDARNEEGCTPLSLAVSEHHKEMVEFLLGKGADVHTRDQSERTPLMTAASGGELNLIKVLLRYGADLSHKDVNGWTAEDYAVIHGYSSVSQHLADCADVKNAGEASAGGTKVMPVLSTSCKAGAAGFALGAPALDRGVIDDFSHGDSIRSSEKEDSDDTWHTSEEEELDFTPKKPQKPNLTLLMNASQQLRKNNDGDGSRIESPKSPKENLKQVTPSDTNLSKGECEELNQDVSDASNLEEEESEEEEEEEEEEDENGDGGDVEDYEEDEEEDLTQDEKAEEDLEDEEETQSDDIVEEEQGEKMEAKGEINQELGHFSSAKYEGEAQCGMGNVCEDHHKICGELEKMEECDTPVSFLAGCYEKSQENIMPLSPPIMSNEISYKSVPKEAVFQYLNNLQDREESWKMKCVTREDFHRNTDSCFADSEMADWKKETALPLSDSCGLKEKKSSFDDVFESGNNSCSEAENPRLESQRQNSVVLECLDAEDAQEEQCEEVDNKVCEALEQESESFCLKSYEEKLRSAFPSSTKEESSEEEEKEEEDNGEEDLQGAGVEGVKNFVCDDSLQVRNASEDHADVRSVTSAAGVKQEEDSDSPWDSEPDSESLRNRSASVLLLPADRRGTCLHSISREQDNGFSEKPSESQQKISESILETNETSPKRGRQKSGEYLEPTFHVSSSAEKKETIKDPIENCGRQDKYVLETTNLIEKTTHENQTDKAEVSHQEALAQTDELHGTDKQLSLKPWEERYERIWVENEKRELKTNFKNITAELKQIFGEVNETDKTACLMGEMSEEDFSEELKSLHVVSPHATESSNKIESKHEFGDMKLVLGLKQPKMEIIIPSPGVLSGQNNLNTNMEDTCSRDEEDCSNDTDNMEVPIEKGEGKQIPAVEMEKNENGNSRNVEGSPEHSLRHYLKTSILDDVSNIFPKMRPVSTNDKKALCFVTEREFGKDSRFNDDVSRDYLTNNHKIAETEIEWVFENAQQSCGVLKRNLDEELEQDMERFKSKVEEEKRKQRCFKKQTVAKQDLGQLNILPGNATNQQMKQKLPLKKSDCLRTENEEMEEEKHKKVFLSKKRSKLIEMPLKSKSALNAKGAKRNGSKKQTSKQKANQQMSSSSGIHFQVLDDSTFSETSQDEGRPAAKRGSEKNKVNIQMDVTDLDLTQSSDTTTEDVELPTSAYKEAMLLIEQLSVDHTGSASLLKIQNILLEYEQIIECEKNRYRELWREVRKLESEKEESQLIAKETQDLKSILAHQEVEWKNDIQSLKFTLKQEEEKRLRVEMLYEKTREQLRKKEDHYCKEMEEKQQLELHSRNLEMELITLRTLLKQVEEERDETQRQLSQEKSARALQEGILNSHLWRQKEIEEETRTIVKGSEVSDSNEREKDLLYKNQLLQDEMSVLRLEVDQVRLRSQEEEAKYLEENETLKEKNEDLKKELKLNEEALTQTVLQYSGQLNLLKTESAVLTSKLEQTKESKDRLETEIESFRSRLSSAVQDLERHQASKSDIERTFQRERDEWLRLQDKLHRDLSDARETGKSLSQQLSKAESKATGLENELHQSKQTLREKTLLLEMTQKELSQAQCQAKECDRARQLEKDQVSKYIIRQESMQERLAQLQSENLLLRQQLEDMQNKGIIKEKVVSDVQDRFNDIFNKLRADTEKQAYLMEERNKELNAKCIDLREQIFKYETDKAEREGMVRQLQQEVADALKKQSMSEASLEVATRYRSDLEEDKLRLQKELDRVRGKLQELEEQHIQSERCVHDLETALENKEREVIASSQKLQDLLEASLGTNTTIKQLEEHVQRLEIENARLEATAKQQTNRIEVLQKDLQASASVHNCLEDLITGLRTAPVPSEEDQNQQMQQQNVLSVTAKDPRATWEEVLKSRSQLEDRLAQVDREKAELLEQCETERKKVKKLIELKRPVEVRLDQEMKRNIELQKECIRSKKLLKTAMKKVKVYEMRDSESQFSSQGEMKNRYSEMVNEVSRLRTKVGELSQQLETESKKSMQLEERNQDLGEELSSMRGNQEKLEKSKCQLKEEVSNLKRRLEANIVDHNQIEQYKKEIEERAGQELRQKLQEVNLFLQTQAASQDRLEQIRASHHASLRNQLKHRIRDLESELDRIKSTQQDNIFQKESTQAEVGKYKELYLEEVKIRRCLANKLERANERLAEANAKLLNERHRSRSLIASSVVSGGGLTASPVLYSTQLGHLGNNLALNRSLSLGGSFMSPSGNALSSRNRVEAYMAKVRRELDEKITKELEQATAELETGSAGASPMVSTDGSSKNVNADQDPLSRAIQEYRDVLTKNYLI
ncbi:ankyrin repeat domain-containing protein 26 isoform X4 [Dromaius novaehollandiae]|uniref:ankyrin repeat domain-containing protein 26 isoform X4 n=1 Tax=Dromaius novaehollandiae TaxID=8790 RepID=UPI00311D8627